jgi:pimeloyl-ACP methyl ester carboxylesterase
MQKTTTATDLQDALSQFDREAVWGGIQLTRYRCGYVSWGNGPPLVFVHGMSDVPRSFAMMMAKLQTRFRCIALYLADGNNDGCRIRAHRHHHYAEDLAEFFDKLNLTNAHLFGSSFGATVVLRFLIDYGHRVGRVILQGGFARRPLNRIDRGMARVMRYSSGIMQNLILRKTVMEKNDLPQFTMADHEIYRFFWECSGKPSIQTVARRALQIHTLDLRPLLGRIQNPILMIGGDRDGLVPREYEAEVEAILPNVSRFEIPECGHYPQYTHPAISAQKISEFINKPDA